MPRAAFITNLAPHYRIPLFERLAQELNVTFFFFSQGRETYLGPGIRHDPAGLPTKEVRRIDPLGHPLLIGLQSELSADRYDVVIKCINGRLMVPYVYRLASQRGLPFVLWTGIWSHPRTPFHRLTRPVVERIYRGSDAIVAYGDHVKAFLTSDGRVDPRKVFVAGQAVDTEPFRGVEPAFEDSSPTVVFVGRLEPAKGITDLLDAMSMLEADARLRIIGDGPLLPVVRQRADADRRIDLVGPVEHGELPGLLADARCLVLPSVTTRTFREPWGLVVNEAMAAGLPVVVTDGVGAAAGGLVRDGENGFVVPESDPPALAAALTTLVGDTARARELGRRGRDDVEAQSFERMTRAFVAATEHALGARS